ncbi:MAG: hypothetical protein AUJ20_01415 [Comamonadaceae bacterium CG1_02_60_18]|nr:MAG: hypothetical protein AUJ20_01415 [Comamonadaceae bacterium CG1_02_60_18]
MAKKKKLLLPLRLLWWLRLLLLPKLLPRLPLPLRKLLHLLLLPLRKLLPSNRVTDRLEKPPSGGFFAFRAVIIRDTAGGRANISMRQVLRAP